MHDKTLKVISKTYGDLKNISRDFSSDIIDKSQIMTGKHFLTLTCISKILTSIFAIEVHVVYGKPFTSLRIMK